MYTIQIDPAAIQTHTFVPVGLVVPPAVGDIYCLGTEEFLAVNQYVVDSVAPLVMERIAGVREPALIGNLVRVTGTGDNPLVYSSYSISGKFPAQHRANIKLPIDFDEGYYHEISTTQSLIDDHDFESMSTKTLNELADYVAKSLAIVAFNGVVLTPLQITRVGRRVVVVP